MAYFNLSVCFAKSGYLNKALETIKNPDIGLLSKNQDFELPAIYNLAIYQLLSKPPNVE